MSLASNFATGYRIGADMRDSKGRKNIVEGMEEYRAILEGGGEGVIDTTDPNARAAKLQAAKKKFYTGLKQANLDVAQSAAMMTAFNDFHAGEVMREGTTALAAWGTDAASGPLQRAFGHILGVDPNDIGVDWTGGVGDDGRAVPVLSWDDDEDPETPHRKMPIDYTRGAKIIQAAQSDPRTLMLYDTEALKLTKEQFDADTRPSVDEVVEARATATAQANEEHEANMILKGSQAASNLASAEHNYARANNQGIDDVGEWMNEDAYSEALFYWNNGVMEGMREQNPQQFDAAVIDAYGKVKAAYGGQHTPSPQAVFDYMISGQRN